MKIEHLRECIADTGADLVFMNQNDANKLVNNLLMASSISVAVSAGYGKVADVAGAEVYVASVGRPLFLRRALSHSRMQELRATLAPLFDRRKSFEYCHTDELSIIQDRDSDRRIMHILASEYGFEMLCNKATDGYRDTEDILVFRPKSL